MCRFSPRRSLPGLRSRCSGCSRGSSARAAPPAPNLATRLSGTRSRPPRSPVSAHSLHPGARRGVVAVDLELSSLLEELGELLTAVGTSGCGWTAGPRPTSRGRPTPPTRRSPPTWARPSRFRASFIDDANNSEARTSAATAAVTAASTCTAPDLAGRTEVWTGTLTAGQIGDSPHPSRATYLSSPTLSASRTSPSFHTSPATFPSTTSFRAAAVLNSRASESGVCATIRSSPDMKYLR